eukprot:TRINITY_DN38123_c0_g1_i1.p1 TRINITY_DN38123_c0_g1~~TRINITY_DN38123_c0_g1_i1.p1  ORF type:complete len:927 (-),score=136.54 TRINITY_DN38123_c0_g1_i1:71-2611(-)
MVALVQSQAEQHRITQSENEEAGATKVAHIRAVMRKMARSLSASRTARVALACVFVWKSEAVDGHRRREVALAEERTVSEEHSILATRLKLRRTQAEAEFEGRTAESAVDGFSRRNETGRTEDEEESSKGNAEKRDMTFEPWQLDIEPCSPMSGEITYWEQASPQATTVLLATANAVVTEPMTPPVTRPRHAFSPRSISRTVSDNHHEEVNNVFLTAYQGTDAFDDSMSASPFECMAKLATIAEDVYGSCGAIDVGFSHTAVSALAASASSVTTAVAASALTKALTAWRSAATAEIAERRHTLQLELAAAFAHEQRSLCEGFAERAASAKVEALEMAEAGRRAEALATGVRAGAVGFTGQDLLVPGSTSRRPHDDNVCDAAAQDALMRLVSVQMLQLSAAVTDGTQLRVRSAFSAWRHATAELCRGRRLAAVRDAVVGKLGVAPVALRFVIVAWRGVVRTSEPPSSTFADDATAVTRSPRTPRKSPPPRPGILTRRALKRSEGAVRLVDRRCGRRHAFTSWIAAVAAVATAALATSPPVATAERLMVGLLHSSGVSTRLQQAVSLFLDTRGGDLGDFLLRATFRSWRRVALWICAVVETLCRTWTAELSQAELRAVVSGWRSCARSASLRAWRCHAHGAALLRGAFGAWQVALMDQQRLQSGSGAASSVGILTPRSSSVTLASESIAGPPSSAGQLTPRSVSRILAAERVAGATAERGTSQQRCPSAQSGYCASMASSTSTRRAGSVAGYGSSVGGSSARGSGSGYLSARGGDRCATTRRSEASHGGRPTGRRAATPEGRRPTNQHRFTASCTQPPFQDTYESSTSYSALAQARRAAAGRQPLLQG